MWGSIWNPHNNGSFSLKFCIQKTELKGTQIPWKEYHYPLTISNWLLELSYQISWLSGCRELIPRKWDTGKGDVNVRKEHQKYSENGCHSGTVLFIASPSSMPTQQVGYQGGLKKRRNNEGFSIRKTEHVNTL